MADVSAERIHPWVQCLIETLLRECSVRRPNLRSVTRWMCSMRGAHLSETAVVRNQQDKTKLA